MASLCLRFLLIPFIFGRWSLGICQLVPAEFNMSVTEVIPHQFEADYDVDVTPAADNLLQRIRSIVHNIRVNGKNALKRLAGATEIIEHSEPTTTSSISSTMHRTVLHRIREYMMRRRGDATTAVPALQRYGALSEKFQASDDEEVTPIVL